MAISFDNALGIHARALAARSERAELLATNIANADTPGYKARDLDFASVLGVATEELELTRSDSAHLPASRTLSTGGALRYRTPLSPSVDGNTVDSHLESMAYLDNALRYQASLQFLNGRISGIRLALRGE